MRLRTRIADEMKARLLATLPEAVETVWDHVAVVVMVEQLKFTSAGGVDKGWELSTSFDGVVRAELRADGIDTLEVEPLIASLVSQSIFLEFEAGDEPGAISETARVTLDEWRDTIRDQDVASALRFKVTGKLAAFVGATPRPEIVLSAAPEIGPGNEGAYGALEDGVG